MIRYLTFKRNFADVIEWRSLSWEIILHYSGGSHIITKILIRAKWEVKIRTSWCDDESKDLSDITKRQRMSQPLEADSLLEPPEGNSPTDTLVSPKWLIISFFLVICCDTDTIILYILLLVDIEAISTLGQ